MREARPEPFKRLSCDQCGTLFEARNKNKVPKRFCSDECKTTWHNQKRLNLYKTHVDGRPVYPHTGQGKKKPRGPSKHAQQASQTVFLALVSVEERAELLRLAAQHLGLTDRDRIEAALRRAEIPNYEECA
ncbi:MAG: hypothetical protein H8K07_01630 [Nitrospira sp.]|nr:hypothetical protein [Nitrospira sp.]